MKFKEILIKIFSALAYLAMVLINYLAVSLPLNNRSTGQISDAYPNLFAPAGITFSIWGVIYLLLGAYVIYQLFSNNKKTTMLLKQTNLLFMFNSIVNMLWIFAWHYDFIWLSLILMIALLVTLIKIADLHRSVKLNSLENLVIKTPFSVYFGWITVATIANITVFLVSIGWNGFGIPDFVWTVVVLFVGMLIGVTRMKKDKNIPYGLVLIWAYFGILYKHTSAAGFSGQYSLVILATSACIIIYTFYLAKIKLVK